MQQYENLIPSTMKEEVRRLSTNWHALLDAMPEMVFLMKNDGELAYMNRNAQSCFSFPPSSAVTSSLGKIVMDVEGNGSQTGEQYASGPTEDLIDKMPVEYSAAPFAGYSGEQLIMLVVRDITQRKQYERRLQEINTDIEHILNQKITELRESEETRLALSHQINNLKNQLGHYHKADKMVGRSRSMQELREMIHQVAGSDATILITGESGTGKELVANLVKATSDRVNKPFLKINCNSINDSILEADLFGYEKGAFTGATSRKVGKFEVVDGGTIFLDEIGDISPRMQVALLRVLQNGEILRVGGTEPIQIDVRIIAATNVDLTQAVKEKKFRLDLYYRLNIINISMPPLRERKEDIVELVSHFVHHYRTAFKKDIDFIPQSTINRLLTHDWPGNVRELENLIQRAVLMAKGKMITEDDLFFDQDPRSDEQKDDGFSIDSKLGLMPLKNIMSEFEAAIIKQALHKYKGNVNTAAAHLKIGKTALYDKMKQHSISAKHIKSVAAK